MLWMHLLFEVVMERQRRVLRLRCHGLLLERVRVVIPIQIATARAISKGIARGSVLVLG